MLSRNSDHVPHTIMAEIRRLTTGSIHKTPVITIARPASTTPKDIAASPAMCMNAARMLMSSRPPVKNMRAVAVFMTMPIAATTMTVYPAVVSG